jgi:5-bromo-4-chloroindolyl phosphate hydrolysis protein
LAKCERIFVLAKDIQDFLEVGNEILDSVSSAIDRNDYSTLHEDVAKAIKSVSVDRKVNYSSQMRQGGQRTGRIKPRIIPFFQKKISRYLGVPQMAAFGAIGAFLFMEFLGMLLIGQTPAAIVSGILVAGCLLGFFSGMKKYELAKKYYQYGTILGDSEYFKISDLAKVAVKSDKEVLKDIKKMIKQGFLPRAKLDSTETTCMITDRAYEQYLGAEQDRMAREERAKAEKEAEIEELKARNAEYANLPKEAIEILEEGREYITFVRQINDVIPDTEELSNKLYRLEDIMNRIFAQVKKDPSSADELHKLMSYYLPTTKKLLNAYVELDKEPEVGVNITQTKMEIDSAIDTINMAFENLLDSLFQDMAWDISSDISVMKTMMAQDGLTTEGQGVMAQTASSASAVATQGGAQAQVLTKPE